ncbi:hypothetical protein HNP84_006376 [Thermocatellispora tengchongensis]|uniref:Secreted protein n=1 Tax=Thermocatellispora tengchongensis TaxID=1073253 RepID=A0A840PKP0_9ACTN|nr:hypothetical protein [Thermocatellispora tengchongensis]MBB5136625.1 hypothetical protein [Thermocatellispora tengchongensis]
MRRALFLIPAAALLVLTACGQGGEDRTAGTAVPAEGADGGSRQGDAAFQEGLLKYARCMRENGVDMPDPQGGVAQMPKAPADVLEKAQKACEKLRPVAPGAPDAEARHQRNVALARCLREKGIDVPDPRPGEGFPVPQGGEKVLQAMRECSAKVRP